MWPRSNPFDMGTDTPVEAVEGLGLPASEQTAVLGGTLARLLHVG
jgi:hypothetical protein